MNSLLVPSNISIITSDNYISIKGPKGFLILSTEGYNFKVRKTPEGIRLAASSSIGSTNQLPISTVLSLIARRIEGISVGYRHRLRLVGVGFRATPATNSVLIKIGYSHDVPLNTQDFKGSGVTATPSRLDGRSKGTIIQFESTNPSALFHQINRVQRFRRPDPYKAKGIHIDGQSIRRKKGKREA